MTRQMPMFDSEQNSDIPADTAMVRIESPMGTAALSKSQKAFNRLIAKIEGQRQLLATWQAFVPEFQGVISKEMQPLEQRMDEQRLAMARLFDAAHDARGVTKRERAKLADLVAHIAEDLLKRSDDPAVVALHDKYSDVSHEEAQQDDADFFKAMAQDVFGVDLDGDDAVKSPEEMMEAIGRKMRQQAEAEASDARPGDDEAQARKKSPKALAREAREQEKALGVTQSVREVYRKLASALHPDRETDESERQRKTVLMQRVNQAYEKNDLLQLLELQMQAEQIDAERLGQVSENRLKHYIVVLKEQARELEQELMDVTRPFAMSMPMQRGGSLTPQRVMQSLSGELAHLRRELKQMSQDLAVFQDLRQLKAWLKQYRIDQPAFDDPSDDDLDDFVAFVDTTRRRRR